MKGDSPTLMVLGLRLPQFSKMREHLKERGVLGVEEVAHVRLIQDALAERITFNVTVHHNGCMGVWCMYVCGREVVGVGK